MPPFRSSTTRKKRFHGPGWRDSCGSMFFQLKRSAENFSRAQEISRGMTMDDLLSSMEYSARDEYRPLGDDLYFGFFLRKQARFPES
ncbi:hypothetical protein HYFRA_00006707 [Hymenoscyphus fraxineus]|uniref:Uncharacterized protein n=1 Tax=Hymenoscyphus fraxineus TaxID=746836 RepID=A0A9N9KT97_9HELO|nr:hypothetical protein HYFRA_00006707 [Hymenoscyphus fraxineus]